MPRISTGAIPIHYQRLQHERKPLLMNEQQPPLCTVLEQLLRGSQHGYQRAL
jgi:hypothetical protein